MKNTIFLILLLCTITLNAQIDRFTQNFRQPFSGIEIIRNQNPLLFIDQKIDNEWVPELKWISIYNPNSNELTYDNQQRWENNEWLETFVDKDSAVLNELGKPTVIYNYRKVDLPTYFDETTSKYEFDFDDNDRPTFYTKYVLNGNNSWKKETDRYFYYASGNMFKEWIKDSVVAENGESWVTYYQWQYINSINKLVSEFTINKDGDTVIKTIYAYNANSDLQKLTRYQWDYDEQTFFKNYQDSFMYQGQKMAGIMSEGIIFDGTNIVFGPFRYETYSFDAEGNITNILERTYEEDEWKLSLKSTFTYENNELKTGFQYNFNPSTNSWNLDPARRYSTTPPTGLTKTQDLLKNTVAYPNPANQVLNIETGINQECTAILTDLAGKTISIHQFKNKFELNTANLTAGYYLIKIESNQQQTVKQIVIAH